MTAFNPTESDSDWLASNISIKTMENANNVLASNKSVFANPSLLELHCLSTMGNAAQWSPGNQDNGKFNMFALQQRGISCKNIQMVTPQFIRHCASALCECLVAQWLPSNQDNGKCKQYFCIATEV